MERIKPKEIRRGLNRPLDTKREIQVLQERPGPVTKYHEDVPELVYRMTRLGMTIAQVAANLKINERTLSNWMQHRKEVRLRR